MKRVNEYRKLFGADESTTLKELKTTYRNLVKEWHPDKFQADDEKAAEAEIMGRKIIDANHFLVSIAKETIEKGKAEYEAAMASGIDDFKHKSLLLEVTFMDGNTYEYFGVNKNLFSKFLNADKQFRFGKRNIFNSHLYRKSKRGTLE
ncbi:MAG: KTSC domain-containing protein [Salibacteraceae bacterium]